MQVSQVWILKTVGLGALTGGVKGLLADLHLVWPLMRQSFHCILLSYWTLWLEGLILALPP